MKEILETIIYNLVDDKDSVEIQEKATEKAVEYQIKVAESDMGKVIGKQGKIAKSIRTLAKSISAKDKKKVTIEFIG